MTKKPKAVGNKKRIKRTSWNPKIITIKNIKMDFHDLENNMTELSSILYELYEKSKEIEEMKEAA